VPTFFSHKQKESENLILFIQLNQDQSLVDKIIHLIKYAFKINLS